MNILSNDEKLIFQYLWYNEDIGKIYWIDKASPKIAVGNEAGALGKHGYILIGLKGKLYLAHRLAWFMTYYVWPTIIDHKDRNRMNNRLSNLREVTAKENAQNSRRFVQ